MNNLHYPRRTNLSLKCSESLVFCAGLWWYQDNYFRTPACSLMLWSALFLSLPHFPSSRTIRGLRAPVLIPQLSYLYPVHTHFLRLGVYESHCRSWKQTQGYLEGNSGFTEPRVSWERRGTDPAWAHPFDPGESSPGGKGVYRRVRAEPSKIQGIELDILCLA